jgi:flagellar hook protein FlgE
MEIVFSKTGVNTWDWAAHCYTDPAGPTDDHDTAGSGTINFDVNGRVSLGGLGTVTIPAAGLTNWGVDDLSVDVDFSGLTQFNDTTTATMVSQNGYTQGSLQSFQVDAQGIITGSFSNGRNQALAQVAVAQFTNPAGLTRVGNTLFEESNNSGEVQIGSAGNGGRGLIKPSNLEMSNVDLSQEFTDMIITQRGFQANSRVITTSDEMLQELVNLKR